MDDQVYLRSIGSQDKIEHNGTQDNFNFSLNNSDDLETIHQLKPEITEDKINKLLLDFFSIRFAHLEESLNQKEIEVYNIMFDLHFITVSAHSIQSQLPKPQQMNKTPIRTGERNQDLNNSRISTVSRKSVSSSRIGKFNVKNKSEPQDKASIFSPKVAINIMFNKDKDTNPSLDKSVLKRSIENKPKNFKPSESETKKQDSNNIKNKDDNKNNIKNDKMKNETMDSKIQHKLNARKYNSDGDNFMKKNDKTFFQQSNNNHNLSNCLNAKANKNILSPSKSSEKVKVPAGTTQANGKIQEKSVNKISHNNQVCSKTDDKKSYPTTKDDLFNKQIHNKTNFKFEPKNNKKADVKNNEKFKTDEPRNINNFSEKIINNNLQEIIDKNLLGNLLNFLEISDKIFFKNSCRRYRRSFLLSELEKISLKLKMKKLEENPFYLMELPKEIEKSFSNQEIMLSKYQNIYIENPSFNNIVNFFYILIFTEKSWENDKFLIEKIHMIENYLESKPEYQCPNINKAYTEVNMNLRNNIEIYQKLKNLYTDNPQTFKLQGLGDEFTYLIQYFSILEQIIIKGSNLEISIDLEILSHKFDIVKTYLDQK